MFKPQGKFGWYELMTSDTKAAGKFYSDVVGWTTNEISNPDGMQYTTFNLGKVGIAGMLSMTGHTSWIGYIAVDDVDAHIEKIVEAGGKLWKPATDVPGMLRFAVLSDPQGAAFVVFTPDPKMPSQERPEPPTPGTIGWHELYTTDLEGGFEFYSKLFGWSKVSDMDMGPMGTYRIFDEGDRKPMGDGGMMKKAPYVPVSSWTFYFNVDSINKAVERVKSGGGKIINGPVQIPGGGWIIQGNDPQGAHVLACQWQCLIGATQSEEKSRTPAFLGLAPDGPTVAFDDLSAGSEPKAGALKLARAVEALEWFEDFPKVLFRDSNTVVAHAE